MGPDWYDLNGRVAIVTGGCSGLGSIFCEALAEAGADIIIADVSVGTPQCEQVCSALARFGKRIFPIQCDITKPEDVDSLVARSVAEFGKIDILVNSAGIFGQNQLVVDMNLENWNRVLAVDLTGSFLCCRAAAKQMIKQNSGKIINIASMSAFKALVNTSAYATAKAGLVMLTKTLALELARYNIQVNALLPGYCLTPLTREFFESDAGKRVMARWPLGRPGNPGELKGIIVCLASSASDYMIGSEILVDGGQTL